MIRKMRVEDFILAETGAWLALNKPAGLIVEESPYEAVSVEALVRDYLHKGRKMPYVGVVHRLDRVTSGVLLVAKKKSALKLLNAQFEQRQIEKTYLAIVERSPSVLTCELQHWLVKNQKEKCSFVFDKQVVDSVFCSLNFSQLDAVDNFSLLKVEPNTGRFHQIRAQLAHIGCAIVGDEKYGAKQRYMDRAIALHAWRLRFTNPEGGEMVEVVAPLPENAYWRFPKWDGH